MIPGIVAGAAVPAMWTPANLTTPPSIWLDDQSAVTSVSGNAASWSDRSGVGLNFTQGSSSQRPIIVPSGLSGRRVLRFDGSNDLLLNNSTAARDLTRSIGRAWSFHVVKRNVVDVSSADRLLWFVPASVIKARFAFSLGQPANLNRPTLTAARLDANSEASIRGPADDGSWFMYMAAVDYAGGTGVIYADGSIDVGPSTLTTSGLTSDTASLSSGLILGAYTTGAAACACDLAAHLFGVGSIPSSAEVDQMFGWAAWHFGLVGSLPIGHPYKLSPPVV